MSSSVAGADTRERILAAAVRRIASEGIDGVRIARIAMDAGVSSSLVHYHFDTREELLGQALDYSYERAGTNRTEIDQIPDATHAQRLAAVVEQCIPTTPELQEDWLLWMELWLRAVRHPELAPVAEGLYARLHAWFADELTAGVAAGEFQPCDVDGLADRTIALLDGLGVRVLIGDRTVSFAGVRDAAVTQLAKELGVDRSALDGSANVP
ncbi:MAG: TetR/AcrR family transcriptional regulator [Solirubrobacteraceae bacterium]